MEGQKKAAAKDLKDPDGYEIALLSKTF